MACRITNVPQPGSDEYARWQNEDKGPSILIVCWLFTGLALVFVAARLFVRGWILKRFHADDYWCSLGWLCALLSTIFATVATSHGNGKHCLFLTKAQQGRAILWTVISWWPGVACFAFPKFAVVSLLTRLLNPSRKHRIFLWALPTLTLINLFIIDMLILFRCSPIQYQWNFTIEHGSCHYKNVILGFSLYAASFSAFVDLYLSIYPSIVLYKLKIPRKKKIYLTIALGLGCVSCVVAIYKTTRLPSGLSDEDVSHNGSDLTIWTVVEGCVIIMACTVPVLAPLLGLFRCSKSAEGSSGEGVAPPTKLEGEDARHPRQRDRETGQNAANRDSSSTSGGNGQDILMHAWETLYGPDEEGRHHYDRHRKSEVVV